MHDSTWEWSRTSWHDKLTNITRYDKACGRHTVQCDPRQVVMLEVGFAFQTCFQLWLGNNTGVKRDETGHVSIHVSSCMSYCVLLCPSFIYSNTCIYLKHLVKLYANAHQQFPTVPGRFHVGCWPLLWGSGEQIGCLWYAKGNSHGETPFNMSELDLHQFSEYFWVANEISRRFGEFSHCFIVFSGGCQSECTVLCSIEFLSSAPSTFASRTPSFSLEQVEKQLLSSCWSPVWPLHPLEGTLQDPPRILCSDLCR